MGRKYLVVVEEQDAWFDAWMVVAGDEKGAIERVMAMGKDQGCDYSNTHLYWFVAPYPEEEGKVELPLGCEASHFGVKS